MSTEMVVFDQAPDPLARMTDPNAVLNYFLDNWATRDFEGGNNQLIGYLDVIQGAFLDDLVVAVRRLVRGEVSDVDPGRVPTAAQLGREVRRMRDERLDRQRRLNLRGGSTDVPPSLRLSPDEMARRRELVARLKPQIERTLGGAPRRSKRETSGDAVAWLSQQRLRVRDGAQLADMVEPDRMTPPMDAESMRARLLGKYEGGL